MLVDNWAASLPQRLEVTILPEAPLPVLHQGNRFVIFEAGLPPRGKFVRDEPLIAVAVQWVLLVKMYKYLCRTNGVGVWNV